MKAPYQKVISSLAWLLVFGCLGSVSAQTSRAEESTGAPTDLVVVGAPSGLMAMPDLGVARPLGLAGVEQIGRAHV